MSINDCNLDPWKFYIFIDEDIFKEIPEIFPEEVVGRQSYIQYFNISN